MFKRSYRKNIGLMAGVEFFAFLGITSFWILFLSQNGMSLWQIGLLESIFHATSVICEIPSGMLADRFCSHVSWAGELLGLCVGYGD